MRGAVVGAAALVAAVALGAAAVATRGPADASYGTGFAPRAPGVRSTYPPAEGPGCDGAPVRGDPSAAANEIQRLGWGRDSEFHRSYTGLKMSGAGIAVYRVRDDALDRAVRRIADSYGVCVDILDAGISLAEMLRLGREVSGRRAALAAVGACVVSIAHESEGRVAVGVSGNVDGARNVLADLGRHVVVTREAAGEPL